MPPRIIFVDCETTGLDPDQHEPFEVALIDHETGKERVLWLCPGHLNTADPGALRVNRYYQRSVEVKPSNGVEIFTSDRHRAAAEALAYATSGAILAGNVVSFDAAMLGRLLGANGFPHAWHYHLLDVEAFAAGALGMEPPWGSEEVSKRLGISVPEGEEAHTALADARWARAMYVAALKVGRF